MSYSGKTDWKYDDLVTEQDLNRIEAGIVDHETRIGAAEADLSDAPPAEVTLTHGMQVVVAPRKTPFRMQSLRGRTVIDETGMHHVVNPYIRRYGENLLPPFTEASSLSGTGQTVISPYEAELNAFEDNRAWIFKIPCVPNTAYTLRVDHNGMIALQDLDKDGVIIQNSYYQDKDELHIFTSSNAAYLNVIIGNGSKGAGTYSFSNPMLNFGDQPLPFVPREDALLAFPDVTLCSNTDGTLYDEIYEQDGRHYKRAQFKALDLDGSLDWKYDGKQTTFKSVKLKVSNPLTDSGQITKYDGKKLAVTYPTTAGDQTFLTGAPDSSVYLTIINADSGWGPDYKPEDDEIKAYFYGYKMVVTGETIGTSQYNGTGIKAWVNIAFVEANPTSTAYTTQSLPTSRDPLTPTYKLQYQLATPITEEVQSVGEVTMNERLNQIEVGCGMILREKANPYLQSTGMALWNINNQNFVTSWLRYKTHQILNIYRNNCIDGTWNINNNQVTDRGSLAQCDNSNYDPTAVYTVDYIALGPYASIPQLTGSYETTLKNVVDRLVEGEAQLAERVGVLESVKASKYPAPPQWIAATLLNNWTNYNSAVESTGYMKDSYGFVHLRGLIRAGVTTFETAIFYLPVGYRPKKLKVYTVASNSGNTATDVLGSIDISPDGKVRVRSTGTIWLSLDIPPFEAEQ